MISVINLFPKLVETILATHKETKEMANSGWGGHDAIHDIRVAQMTLVLGYETNPHEARLACCAALLHSIDWILKRKLQIKTEAQTVNIPNVPEEKIKKLAEEWLEKFTDIRDADKELVITSAVQHGSRPNHPDDSLVFILLTDADKLINMEVDVLMRSGQHHANSQILDPIYFENEPNATYQDHKTTLWDIWHCTTWMDETGPYILRLPKARELGKERAEFLLFAIQTLKNQIGELNFKKWPKF